MGSDPEKSSKDKADDPEPRQDAETEGEKQAAHVATKEQQDQEPDASASVTGSGSSSHGKEGKDDKGKDDLRKLDSHVVRPQDEKDLDSALAHLPDKERAILKEQLLIPDVKTSYFTLYRYSSTNDILILLVSSLCSIAAGAALPMFTVCAFFFCFGLMALV